MSAASEFIFCWNGISITVRHARNWSAGFDQIEIISANRVPLPLSETGYRSHFLPGGWLEPYDSVEAYIRLWLDHAAESKEWSRHVEECRQMSLF